MDPEEQQKIIADLDKTCPHYLRPDGKHSLNTNWILWYHSAESRDWSLDGYKKYAVIGTVEDFWEIYNDLPSINNRDMWFLMREGFPPRWEDPVNAEGGSFKFRVRGDEAENAWLTLSTHLISENLCKGQADSEFNSGLGVSPKKNGYVTISVWNLDKCRTASAQFPTNIPGINFSSFLYEAHSDRHCG